MSTPESNKEIYFVFVEHGDEASGPFSLLEMQQMWNYGLIKSSTYYCVKGGNLRRPNWRPIGGLAQELSGIKQKTISIPPDHVSPLFAKRHKKGEIFDKRPLTPWQSDKREDRRIVCCLTVSHSIVPVILFALFGIISWGTALVLGVYLLGWLVYFVYSDRTEYEKATDDVVTGWQLTIYWAIALWGSIWAVLASKVDGGILCSGLVLFPMIYMFSKGLWDSISPD